MILNEIFIFIYNNQDYVGIEIFNSYIICF